MENTKDVYTQTISYEELMNEIYKLYVSNNDRMNLIIDTEIISESGSEEYVESNIYDKLDENDIEELNNTSELYILEYIENNLLYFSKGNFDTEIAANVTYILYQSLYDNGIINEEDYDDLYEHIHNICNHTLSTVDIPSYFEYHIKDFITQNINREFIDNLHNCKFRVPESVKTRNAHLSELKDVKQRTNEWYELRHNILTASSIWKIFSTDSQRNSLIYEKCSPYIPKNIENVNVNTLSPLHWGVKYEPLTIMLYEAKNDTKIDEFGCIQHPIYDFIGASPDGINVKEGNLFGRMVEIKNIVNREITGMPSEAYWIQMQIQMECCNIDLCDFIETRFKEYESEEAFYNETNTEMNRGIILHYIDKSLEKSQIPHYEYMPLNIELDKETITNWIKETNMKKPDYILYEVKYWYLDEYMCVSVKRNQMWFQEAIHKIKDIWNIIEKERIEGYQHRAPKKKIKQVKNEINQVIKLDTEPLCNIVLEECDEELEKEIPINGDASVL